MIDIGLLKGMGYSTVGLLVIVGRLMRWVYGIEPTTSSEIDFVNWLLEGGVVGGVGVLVVWLFLRLIKANARVLDQAIELARIKEDNDDG